MLELVDPCFGLVQTAEGHQQLIMIVLAITIVVLMMLSLHVIGNGGSDQLPPFEGILVRLRQMRSWIIRRFIFCIRKKGDE